MRKTFLVLITLMTTCGLTACGTSAEVEKTGADTTEQVIEETIQEENILVEDTITEQVDRQPEEEDYFNWDSYTDEELLEHVFTEEEMLEMAREALD